MECGSKVYIFINSGKRNVVAANRMKSVELEFATVKLDYDKITAERDA